MYGISTTKLGGIVPANKSYGPRVTKFRYLRIFTPDNRRMELQPIAPSSSYHGRYHFIDIRESESSPNIMMDEAVTIWSDVEPRTSTDYWLSRMRLGAAGFLQFLSYTQNSSPSLYIDFNRRVHLYKINLCIETTLSGYILHGSNDLMNWQLIGDTTQHELAEVYPEIPWGHRWYSHRISIGLKKAGMPYQSHKYWGILVGDIARNGSYFSVRQIEFRNAIGGSNLVGSGTPTAWITCNDRSISEAFDSNLSTECSIYQGHGAGYQFPSPLLPVTIAINAGRGYSSTALGFMVVYSDDEITWHKHKYFSTPEGTWPDGTQATVEFIL